MLAGKRSIRVGDQILKEIATLLMEKVKDPRQSGMSSKSVMSSLLRQGGLVPKKAGARL